MGVRGEIFSQKVILPNRTYFFNVKENRLGDLYLNIVESKNRDNGGFERQSVILFADDLQEFLKGFDESLKVLEKATREKRHGGKGNKPSSSRRPRTEGSAGFEPKVRQGSQGEDRGGERPRRERGDRARSDGARSDRPNRGRSDRPARSGDRPGRERSKERSFGNRERSERPARERSGDRPDRGRRNERGGDRPARGGKRVVVKKRD